MNEAQPTPPQSPLALKTARRLCHIGCITAVVASIVLLSLTAQATVVERVVAVIGQRAVLLSELRTRAKPFLSRIHREVPPGAPRTAAVSQLYSSLLDRMIDEELQHRTANKARLGVTAQEVDDALKRVAKQNKLTVKQLLDEARSTGLSPRDYRKELHQQLLEAKLINLRVQGRIRVSEADLHASYRAMVLDERRRLPFRIAMISLDPKAAGAKKLAASIAKQAQDGSDFATLARRHSDDKSTRSAGGLLPKMAPGKFAPSIDKLISQLEVGETSAPISTGPKLVVIQLIEREASQLPAYEASKREIHQRVYMNKMEKARRQWLDGLRKRTHVDIRL
ncbi:MAG: peptidylprolyl isomerase [Polyangiaceae bacterium]|nr:peptidylprolyl isomerase [Polyangiaceae bacterium]